MSSATAPAALGGRYSVARQLGRGGMAAVYEAHDASSGRIVAIKQLIAGEPGPKAERAERLFEQEFLTLSQLAHPRVIEVYDYDRDDNGPFYTMELLDGGDLRELTPLPWQRACALLRDVCSALSLLHSRRLVHRDLTPRNIRCTKAGTAKLIDFGAMAPFGPARQVIGTPPFVAPEALTGQALDARTDLFALGATAYFAITGRHAYPARSFDALRNAWRSRPAPPSALAPEVPEELDRLVMSLLHLSPLARPGSAAEVMERLSGIAGFALDEQLVVRQAYLSAPSLVGRDDSLLSVRKRIMRAARGRGGSIVVSGAPGVGRSRFLDACVLEGKLVGSTVLRADATDAAGGAFSVARALLSQLVDALPGRAVEAMRPYAPVLASTLGQLPQGLDPLRGSGQLPRFDSPEAQRGAVQAAIRNLLLDISRKKPVLIAVDDVQRIDEPSAALLALLTHSAPGHALCLVVTLETEVTAQNQQAVAVMARAGGSIRLRNLSQEHTERLLVSVFGEVPNLRLLADRLHAISEGNPRAVMQLAQHLLDRGVLRYEAGAWTLPAEIDSGDLPASLGDALAARIAQLSAGARRLGQALAASSLPALSFEQCLALALHETTPPLVRDLDELVSREVFAVNGDHYSLAQPALRRVLLDALDPVEQAALHARLARMFADAPRERFRVVVHSLRAGNEETALDLLLEHARERLTMTASASQIYEEIRHFPEGWLDVIRSLVSIAEARERPAAEVYLLRAFMASAATAGGQSPTETIEHVLSQMRHASGLDLYAELDESLDPPARLAKALELAQKRYDETPENERTLPVGEAIPRLAQLIIQVIAVAARDFDYALLERAPSLEPLLPLSPALSVVRKNHLATLHILAGRMRPAAELYREILALMAAPDGGGVDPLHRDAMRCAIEYALGALEIQAGIPSGVQWADAIEGNLLFSVNAWRLRMMHALRQGDWEQVEDHRARLELLQLQNSPPQLFEGGHIWTELMCYAGVEDLVRVKQLIPSIEARARSCATWEPCAHAGRGTYHMLRGDATAAVEELESAVAKASPGRHLAWPWCAGMLLHALNHGGRRTETVARGRAMLETAREHEIDSLVHYIEQPLCLAEAAEGELSVAQERAESIIAHFEKLGATGVSLGTAYETRARVASLQGDVATFESYAARCAQQYRNGRNPALTAKYERLLQFARKAQIAVSGEVAHAADLTVASAAEHSSTFATLLSTCQGPHERAQETLRCLVERSTCVGGFLYAMHKSGPVLVAELGGRRPPVDLDTWVRQYIAAEIADAEEATATAEIDALPVHETREWSTDGGERYIPMLLSHENADGFVVTGLAALCVGTTGTFVTPDGLLRALSRALLDAGDVVTVAAG